MRHLGFENLVLEKEKMDETFERFNKQRYPVYSNGCS